MTQLELIKQELKRRIEGLDKYKDVTETAASARQELIYFQSFIESLEEEQEDTDFVKQELKRIREAEKKVKLPELIDFWWIQEDSEGNRMIARDKEHFASAMRKAYNVGLSQSESLEKDAPKIKGWVARENPNTNLPKTSLSFFTNVPQKREDIFGEYYWGCNGGRKFTIPKDAFPNLKFTDEPIEVELIISLVVK